MANMNEVNTLRQLAIENYDADEGVMYECFSQADYIDYIERFTTAAAAWTYHMRLESARAEVGGKHEADF